MFFPQVDLRKTMISEVRPSKKYVLPTCTLLPYISSPNFTPGPTGPPRAQNCTLTHRLLIASAALGATAGFLKKLAGLTRGRLDPPGPPGPSGSLGLPGSP